MAQEKNLIIQCDASDCKFVKFFHVFEEDHDLYLLHNHKNSQSQILTSVV